jgi:hypothetical protein
VGLDFDTARLVLFDATTDRAVPSVLYEEGSHG